jgi:glycosyltransferase involved in cell wall biosynthesis
MAGPAPDANIMQEVHKLDLLNDIQFVINPSDQDIINYYQAANIFLFPSIYEGFGWPPLEAMACGCPVVASNAGSLPEVTGPAPTANHQDHQALAQYCLNILQNKHFAQELSLAGKNHTANFTVKSMGQKVHDFYLSRLNQR